MYINYGPGDGTGGSSNIVLKGPVQDIPELQQVGGPVDTETRQILDELPNIVKYTFNTLATSGLPANDGTPGFWNVSQKSTDGLRKTPATSTLILAATVKPDDYEIRRVNADINDPTSVDTEYVFNKGTVADTSKGDLVGDGGAWVKVIESDGLRGSPVQDSTELSAIVARDFELRQILADPTDPQSKDREYVFKEGATAGDFPGSSSNSTGFWNEIVTCDGIKVDYIDVTTDLQKNVPVAFTLKNILVFRNGLLAEDDTYQVAADRKSLDTFGERKNSVITVVEISSGCKLTKKEKRCFGGEIDYDTGDDIGLQPLVFSNGVLLNDTEFTVSSVSSVTFNNPALKNEVLSIVYKGN